MCKLKEQLHLSNLHRIIHFLTYKIIVFFRAFFNVHFERVFIILYDGLTDVRTNERPFLKKN